MTPFLAAWVLVFLGLESFFSGSEIAIISCDKVKLRSRAASGSASARLLEGMLARPEWLIGTTVIGTTVAVAANTIMVSLTIQTFLPRLGELVTVLVMSPLILFFGEILPKSFFQRKADVLAPKVIYPIWLASRLFSPVLFLVTAVARLLAKETTARQKHGHPLLRREDLKALVHADMRGGDVKVEKRRMVDRLFELSDTTVEETMIPLINVAALPETATWREAAALILEKGHSRIPVYRERIDQIVGIVTHFDLLLAKDREGPISPLVQPCFFVPETKPVQELLLQMKKSGHWMAVAVDEYGGAVGIITVEDIVEEIVGEIEDEYDDRRSLYRKLDPHTYIIHARIEIDYINEKLPFEIPQGDYETLGGFLLAMMGRVPEEGETFRYGSMLFTIEKATPRSIEEVRLTLQPPIALQRQKE